MYCAGSVVSKCVEETHGAPQESRDRDSPFQGKSGEAGVLVTQLGWWLD